MDTKAAMMVSAEQYRHIIAGLNRQEQGEWERARWICYNMLQQLPYVKHKPANVVQYCRFPWDRTETRKPKINGGRVTPEQVAALYDIYKDFISRKANS